MGCCSSKQNAGPSSARSSLSKPVAPPIDSKYVINIIGATDVPKLDVLSESDPYVKLQILNALGDPKGPEIRTLTREDNPNPIWNCYRSFTAFVPDDTLHFELWDCDGVADKDDLIGTVDLKLDTLPIINDQDDHKGAGDHRYEVDVQLKSDKLSAKHNTKISFTLSQLNTNMDQQQSEEPTKKTMFFIRHGESEWNAAQHNKSLHKMYKQVDHPLNDEGIAQGILLNDHWKDLQKEGGSVDLTDFLHSEIIYASPLCRATQTAILTLLDHPCLMKDGLCYARNLREIKTAGGADTMANKTGMVQYRKAIDNIIKHEPELKDKIETIVINTNDAEQKWWTASMDSTKGFHRRLEDFLYFLRFQKEEKVICVGHSLWFKGFAKRYVEAEDEEKEEDNDQDKDGVHVSDVNVLPSAEEDPDQEIKRSTLELKKRLKEKKVENAGCVRVDIEFSDDFPNGVKIANVRLLFGTELV